MMHRSKKHGSWRWYGWVPQKPDFRDVKFSPPLSQLLALPPSASLRDGMGPVLDQGQLGTCGPNAVSSLMMYDLAKQKQAATPRSRLHTYYWTRALMGTLGQDSGVDNRTMLKALNKYGECSEDLWAYNISKYDEEPPDAANSAAKGALVQSYATVQQDAATMRATIAGGLPFLFGFTVYESFESDETARTGLVPMPRASEQVLGGHDVAICGYDDSKQLFTFKNSWGDWGDGGYGYFPYAYCLDSQLSSDFWVINAVPGELPPGPPPQPSSKLFSFGLKRQLSKGSFLVMRTPVDIPAGSYDVSQTRGGTSLHAVEAEEGEVE